MKKILLYYPILQNILCVKKKITQYVAVKDDEGRSEQTNAKVLENSIKNHTVNVLTGLWEFCYKYTV